MVSQAVPQVEHYTRELGGEWVYRLTNHLKDAIRLKSVNRTLSLSDIYDRIEFQETEPEAGQVDFEESGNPIPDS
jgi:hypothetical protein